MWTDGTSLTRWAVGTVALPAALVVAAPSGCGGKSVVGDGSGGSGASSTTSTTSTGSGCPPASSPGCCYGDGFCCSCVAKICDDSAMGSDPGVQELTACVCQPDVCGDDCDSACASNGIDQECLPCVEEAAQSTCEQAYLSCATE